MSLQLKTARDLFLAHHWRRYLPYGSQQREVFTRVGRIVARKPGTITMCNGFQAKFEDRTDFEAGNLRWATDGLREPSARESLPPVSEVLSLGDWVGISARGDVLLFAPCGDGGASSFQYLHEMTSLNATAHLWSQFLKRVRDFFQSRGFTELTTPTLAPSPGTEPFLDPLCLEIRRDGKSKTQYLITSPEFHLKRAMGAGLSPIFEIAKCFRNNESGDHHALEFHMLEWYRAFASLDEIATDVEELILCFDSNAKLVRTTVAELFQQRLGFDLTPTTNTTELIQLAKTCDVHVSADDGFNDVFHRIFISRIEPQLNEMTKRGPVLLGKYPPPLSALARIDAKGWADRFEIYWQGLEIANAFHELNDPTENRQRFGRDNVEKQNSGRAPVPLDFELLRQMDLGLPPAGGIALGLERLCMAVQKAQRIADVRPFTS